MLITHLIIAAVAYLSPVHLDVSLAGNFGEPRPNHFHGGLDIKTMHEEGKGVYSIGDGYVSRVAVNVGGMGNAIYVRHPEGYTSVYAHLQRFAPAIEMLVQKWQYEHHCTDVDLELEGTDYPVAAGQILALSGDTGASMGPHLHLEIHETDTWTMLDPLDFLPDLLEDSVAPKAHSIMAYPIKGEGRFCGQDEQMRFDFMGYAIVDSLTAWGKVGFGLYAEDFMQGSDNRYGIRKTQLLVDGKEVFSSDVNRIAVKENMMVNVWGDYDYYANNHLWFLRSYLLPGNQLSFLKTDANKGIVDFNEERDYVLTYVLSDFFGNTSRYQFVVSARHDTISPVLEDDSLTLDRTVSHTIRHEGMQLDIPAGSLLQQTKVSASSRRMKAWSPEYQLANKSIPLYKKAHLRLQLNKVAPDNLKLYISARRRTQTDELDPEKGQQLFVDAQFNEGWVEGDIADLGHVFTIEYDDQPPRIIPIHGKGQSSLLLFDLKDDQTGISSFEGYVDDRFVLFDHVKKSSRIICDLRNTPIHPTGKDRHVRLKARDFLGNESIYDTTINY